MTYNSFDLPLIVSTGHFNSQTVHPMQVFVMKYAMLFSSLPAPHLTAT
jgi:hypothetical protein